MKMNIQDVLNSYGYNFHDANDVFAYIVLIDLFEDKLIRTLASIAERDLCIKQDLVETVRKYIVKDIVNKVGYECENGDYDECLRLRENISIEIVYA